MISMTIWLLSNPLLPFEMVHVKKASPAKPAGGMYKKPPCALKEARVPSLGAEQLSTLKTPLGPGLSFARIPGAFMLSICPDGVVKKSNEVNPVEGFDELNGVDGEVGLGGVEVFEGEGGFDGIDEVKGEDGFEGIDGVGMTPMIT